MRSPNCGLILSLCAAICFGKHEKTLVRRLESLILLRSRAILDEHPSIELSYLDCLDTKRQWWLKKVQRVQDVTHQPAWDERRLFNRAIIYFHWPFEVVVSKRRQQKVQRHGLVPSDAGQLPLASNRSCRCSHTNTLYV